MLGDYLTNRAGQTPTAFVVLLRLQRAQSSRKNEAAGAKRQGGLASYNPFMLVSRHERRSTLCYVALRRVVDEKNTRKYFAKNAGSQKSASRPN